MNNNINTKLLILNKLHKIIDGKLDVANNAIKLAKEARNNDTKSSAGDKFETGRAMMQIEIENSSVQLNKALFNKTELSKINIKQAYDKVEFGSLVITNQGNYFISIGIGKLEIANKSYFCISLASPIGQILHAKKNGDTATFQNREFIIEEII